MKPRLFSIQDNFSDFSLKSTDLLKKHSAHPSQFPAKTFYFKQILLRSSVTPLNCQMFVLKPTRKKKEYKVRQDTSIDISSVK